MASIFTRKGKKGEYRYLTWMDPSTGKQQKKPLGLISMRVAESFIKKKEAELLMETITPTDKNRINFGKYVDIYLKDFEISNPPSYETSRFALIENLSPQLNEFGVPLENLYLDELTSNDVKNFIHAAHARGLLVGTINRKLGILSAFLNRAKDDGYTAHNFKIKKLPVVNDSPPKYYDLDVLKRIINADKRHHHWWKFIANTGIRAGEFRNIKVKDCKDDGIYILSKVKNKALETTGRTKSGKWRIIPMNDTIREVLKDFDMTGEYLIPRYNKDYAKTEFRRLCKRIGIEEGYWGIHCLRRTFCSQLIMAGKSMRAAQILMGHLSITTTERYAFLSPNYLEGVMDDFGIG